MVYSNCLAIMIVFYIFNIVTAHQESDTQNLRHVFEKLDSMDMQLKELKEENELMRKENQELSAEVKSIKSKRLLAPVANSNQETIGFYARRRTSGTIGIQQTLEFDHVHINSGNAYDARHGHFTAPVAGLYHFSTTVYSNVSKGLHCEMVKNGQNVGQLYAPIPGYASSTLNAIVQLDAGDMVWVRHLGSESEELNANDYSTFSGFLIAKSGAN